METTVQTTPAPPAVSNDDAVWQRRWDRAHLALFAWDLNMQADEVDELQ